MIITIYIILLIIIFVILRKEYLMTPALSTNVYTFTPEMRSSTCSEIAQMWWQPVSYILNTTF